MKTSYTDHFRERTGASAGEEPVYLLEISHEALAEPVRVVRDTVNLTIGHHVSVSGAAGNFVSSPDSAAASITGDLDLVCRLAPSVWAPPSHGAVMAKWTTTGNQRAYMLRMDTAARLQLFWSTAGSDSVTGLRSTVAVPFADGAPGWVRATRSASSGDIKYYTSTDGVAWTQLGSTRASTPSGIFDSSARVSIGALDPTGNEYAGKFYYGEIRAAIDGAVVLRFDANDGAIGENTFTSLATGEIYTVNTSGTPGSAIAADTTFIAMAFDIQMPDDVARQLPRAPIRIDNVGDELSQVLEATNGGRGAQVRVMQVMRDTPEVIEYDITMDLLNVKQNRAWILGDLGFDNMLGLAGLAVTYRPDNTPGLF